LTALSQRLKKALSATAAVSLAAGLALALWMVTFGAQIRERERLRASSAELGLLSQRFDDNRANVVDLRRRLGEMSAVAQGTNGLLDGVSAPVAAANLQTSMRAVIERHGGIVRSSQNLEPRRGSGLDQIGVALEFRGSLETLAATLQSIEAGEAVVLVDRLSVRVADASAAAAQVNTTPLQVRLDLIGFWRGAAR
jgi:hypothetical protein